MTIVVIPASHDKRLAAVRQRWTGPVVLVVPEATATDREWAAAHDVTVRIDPRLAPGVAHLVPNAR